ncbi:MAG: hypothetical protein C7B46_19060 [Sulfobacillus benefaciens]|uniref:Uncharacterized protein n=1 Tax=Sulfobacillus benefaciens TaxID=453960 RepID=A0A2T2X1C6_9FIRM|nr:MAG: hypothetical protein C7B46_19060 [Sulfobacillus benefaciens]
MPELVNHWWITRPKRKLTLLIDILRVFFAVARGEQWHGNRALQRLFEEALEEAYIKRKGDRREGSGSGGRTYASWLQAFGLWFADQQGRVWPTWAGQDLIDASSPGPIMLHQLLAFQYPSVYSRAARVSDRFNGIFPYRLLLQFLADEDLGHRLTHDELGLIIATEMDSISKYDLVKDKILGFRGLDRRIELASAILGDGWERIYGHPSKLRDTAHTMFCHLEFVGLATLVDDGTWALPDDKLYDLNEMLSGHLPPFINLLTTSEEDFQRKFGRGPHHQKDTRNMLGSHTVSAADAEAKRVLWTYYGIVANNPFIPEEAIIDRVSVQTGISMSKIRAILQKVSKTKPSNDEIALRYLELARGGREAAVAFEQATAEIFGPWGLGFESEWIGAHPNHPDVRVLNVAQAPYYAGILDAKAYEGGYDLPRDHERRMYDEYIPAHRHMKRDEHIVPLRWFGYVSSSFGANFDRKLTRIAQRGGVSGFAISADTLLALVQRHKQRPLTEDEFCDLFSVNREVMVDDFSTA